MSETRDLAERIWDALIFKLAADPSTAVRLVKLEHAPFLAVARAELAASPELREVREAMERFAKMDREESDLPDDHAILSRGVASDLTILFEGDFREATRALAALDRITGKLP